MVVFPTMFNNTFPHRGLCNAVGGATNAHPNNRPNLNNFVSLGSLGVPLAAVSPVKPRPNPTPNEFSKLLSDVFAMGLNANQAIMKTHTPLTPSSSAFPRNWGDLCPHNNIPGDIRRVSLAALHRQQAQLFPVTQPPVDNNGFTMDDPVVQSIFKSYFEKLSQVRASRHLADAVPTTSNMKLPTTVAELLSIDGAPLHGAHLGYHQTPGNFTNLLRSARDMPKKRKRYRYICKHKDCDKSAKGGGFCIAHGGGTKCSVAGCTKVARFAGSICHIHRNYKPEKKPSPDNSKIGSVSDATPSDVTTDAVVQNDVVTDAVGQNDVVTDAVGQNDVATDVAGHPNQTSDEDSSSLTSERSLQVSQDDEKNDTSSKRTIDQVEGSTCANQVEQDAKRTKL